MKLQVANILATVFFIGKFPFAPGTAASLSVNFFLYIFYILDNSFFLFLTEYMFLIVPFLFLIGVVTSNIVISDLKVKDPSIIVIDEWVGQWIPFMFLSINIENLIISFFLFRFFDISKVLYIKELEKLPNGWGVMMDDVLAGVYSLAILLFINLFIFY